MKQQNYGATMPKYQNTPEYKNGLRNAALTNKKLEKLNKHNCAENANVPIETPANALFMKAQKIVDVFYPQGFVPLSRAILLTILMTKMDNGRNSIKGIIDKLNYCIRQEDAKKALLNYLEEEYIDDHSIAISYYYEPMDTIYRGLSEFDKSIRFAMAGLMYDLIPYRDVTFDTLLNMIDDPHKKYPVKPLLDEYVRNKNNIAKLEQGNQLPAILNNMRYTITNKYFGNKIVPISIYLTAYLYHIKETASFEVNQLEMVESIYMLSNNDEKRKELNVESLLDEMINWYSAIAFYSDSSLSLFVQTGLLLATKISPNYITNSQSIQQTPKASPDDFFF